MKENYKRGTTSKTIAVHIADATGTANDSGLTGLVFNTANLVAWYKREGDSSDTQISLVTATLGTWTSGGFKEVDATNMPGLYEISLPNAMLASGSWAVLYVRGAANMLPVRIEITLEAVDNQDATRYGLTALPNANAGANGGLPTGNASAQVAVQYGTGAGQINLSSGNLASVTVTSIAADAVNASALAADAIAEIMASMNANVIEGTLTFLQAQRLLVSSASGPCSGGNTTTMQYKDTTNTKTRITATVDQYGDRSGLVYDVS